MNEKSKCPCCGGSELIPGSLHSTGKVYFRPEKVKFSVPKTSTVAVRGVICLECGHIGMTGDSVKVRGLLPTAKV